MSSTMPPQGDPEYLEFGRSPERKPRRGLFVGIVAGVLVALVLPLGAFAVFRLLSGGGTQPHDVLPANAVAYFRVDLDPNASQKIDAIRFLRTFPAFEKYTRITDDRADVREVVFDEIVKTTPCTLDYQDDVEPWLGERLGVAVMAPTDGDQEPGFAVAVQVSDEDGARAGMERLRSCAGASETGGWTYLDGYLIVSENERAAKRWADAATQRSLGETTQFQQDMDRLGEPGVASAWLSGEGLFQMWSSMMIGVPGTAGAQVDQMQARTERMVTQSYRSVAIAFRFDARYAEVATLATGTGYEASADGGVADMELPETTALALGFADGEQYVGTQWEMFLDMAGGGPVHGAMGDPDAVAGQAERALGLRLPEDLRTLVGDSFTLALDGDSIDVDTLVATGDLSSLDLGARVDTDSARFREIVETLQVKAREAGAPPFDLTVTETEDGAVVATTPEYAEQLRDGGSLVDTDVFRTAVADADDAQAVFFVNVDSVEDQIVELLRRDGADPEAIENLTKIEAFGISGTIHDGYVKSATRLSVAD